MKQKGYELSNIGDISSAEVFELHRRYLNSGYVKMMDLMDYGRVFYKADGCILEDKEGREYLDMMGGYGSLNLGHNHPAILQSLNELIGKPNLVHNSLSPYAAVLASNLAELTNGELTRTFLCSSGSEAVEAALKLARAATGKSIFIYCKDAFHGKSLGALSVSGRDHYKTLFQPLISNCVEVPFGDIDSLEELLQHEDAAAFILEPIQGEGGVNLPQDGYLQKVRDLCTKYQTLLILDEVQTGMGRTGRMFAYEHEGIVPDILCLAKSLGGGIMPIGACITSNSTHERAYGEMEKCLLHSATFGGNSYACAAAIATIETLVKEGIPKEVEIKGFYLINRLNQLKTKYSSIKDVRGKGLLIGLEFHRDPSRRIGQNISNNSLQHLINGNYALLVTVLMLNRYGILTGYSPSNPDLIRIEPPLTISYNQMDCFVDTLEQIMEGYIHG
ncbi:aminotransferase class III-fold pyridoxal phosphate-dependent enzyme [Paenibacillus sp. LMG 31461]|uniref:Aminotransferase class III-fold pyridoxal phosphate-dependent enzyme n=1 Tax=Paenibacillus plantarum TaxID=2654975 RepID=A0ABX1X4A7_9BACL|nr:aspartate aminotransferase family protein [Paenibacillus plantarum]NOU63250.1 aminotransferase class III-fold pyridoxal phosphate-dependent enzyme [Paenibacillus plantarum]